MFVEESPKTSSNQAWAHLDSTTAAEERGAFRLQKRPNGEGLEIGPMPPVFRTFLQPKGRAPMRTESLIFRFMVSERHSSKLPFSYTPWSPFRIVNKL